MLEAHYICLMAVLTHCYTHCFIEFDTCGPLLYVVETEPFLIFKRSNSDFYFVARVVLPGFPRGSC